MKWSALAEKVHQSLIRNSLLKENTKLLLAISGGMDSVVMLRVFLELRKTWKWELVVGHIDHGLRPGQDEKESNLCRSLAQDHQLEYREQKLDLKKSDLRQEYSEYSSQTPSLESLARFARYENLSKWAHELNCDAVCIAHHASDQAETILYRLLTGSGIKGLGGIPVSRDLFKRPLLNVFKKDIEEYAYSKNIRYFDDESNLDTAYVRNKIRHTVIPSLIKMGFENCEKALFDSSRSIEQAYSALNLYIKKEKEKLVILNKGRIELDLKKFTGLPIFVQKEIIKQIYKENLNIQRHISDDQTEQILSFFERSDIGTVFELHGIKMIKERKNIIWKHKGKTNIDEHFICSEKEFDFTAGALLIEKIPNKQEHKILNNNTAFFSLDLLGKKINLRSWKNGDKIRIFGEGRQKKVSNVLKDEKVESSEKQNFPVLECEGDIIWIPGVKRSNLFIVEQEDKTLLQITYKTEKEHDQKNPDA